MTACVIYATKTGTTMEAARMISERLGGCDVFKIDSDRFDLSKYDTVIIGSNIRIGTIDRNIRRLLLEYIKPLYERKVAFFICCAYKDNGELYLNQNIPPQLLGRAIASAAVGGELDMSRLFGMDKMVAKTMIKANKENNLGRDFKLDIDRIDEFVDKIKNATEM